MFCRGGEYISLDVKQSTSGPPLLFCFAKYRNLLRVILLTAFTMFRIMNGNCACGWLQMVEMR
jgi:hypothetical protein